MLHTGPRHHCRQLVGKLVHARSSALFSIHQNGSHVVRLHESTLQPERQRLARYSISYGIFPKPLETRSLSPLCSNPYVKIFQPILRRRGKYLHRIRCLLIERGHREHFCRIVIVLTLPGRLEAEAKFLATQQHDKVIVVKLHIATQRR